VLVRTVQADNLMREAARLLAPVRDDVVIIGAVAVQIALDGHPAALTPTRDVDVAVQTEAVESVVAQLIAARLEPSEVPHERGFTWIKGDLKVQLLRPFHPFPSDAAKRLPVNNMIPELDMYRDMVAFADSPTKPRLWIATPSALVGLKELAFGRERATGETVDRDFSDVFLLIDRLSDEIAAEVSRQPAMRLRVKCAAERLLDESAATEAAARELTAIREYANQREAELNVRRSSQRFLRRLQAT
jgi:hypothetical protein